MVTTALLIVSALLNIAMYSANGQAYSNGQVQMYVDMRHAVKTAEQALDAIRPPKSRELTDPLYNSKDEMHPQIAGGNSLEQFVYNNCTPEVLDVYDDIVVYALSKGLQPSIPFAIAWADTQCGQMLTTPHNYGNVGNTDGGKRIGYFNALDGFKAIVDALNNDMLKGNNEVWQLSQGGRTLHGSTYNCSNAPAPYKCYATSEEDWHRNVTSAIMQIFDLTDPPLNWKYRIK